MVELSCATWTLTLPVWLTLQGWWMWELSICVLFNAHTRVQ